MFSEKEKSLEELYRQSSNHDQLILMRFLDGREFVVKPDTWFTDENDFDETDERYEEWECGVFEIVEILSDPEAKRKVGDLIEVTYKDFPVEIRYGYLRNKA